MKENYSKGNTIEKYEEILSFYNKKLDELNDTKDIESELYKKDIENMRIFDILHLSTIYDQSGHGFGIFVLPKVLEERFQISHWLDKTYNWTVFTSGSNGEIIIDLDGKGNKVIDLEESNQVYIFIEIYEQNPFR